MSQSPEYALGPRAKTESPAPVLQWTYTDVEARAPTYGSADAIGLDLYASEAVTVWNGSVTPVGTGIAVAIPHGYYGRIAPRSGLALKHAIDVMAGVIDSDYRGEIKVLLTRCAPGSFDIKVGDRIAQLILERADRPKLQYVSILGDTERGAAGFGSTGTK
jgi:dUTP pyrophosphatase